MLAALLGTAAVEEEATAATMADSGGFGGGGAAPGKRGQAASVARVVLAAGAVAVTCVRPAAQQVESAARLRATAATDRAGVAAAAGP